MQLRQSDQIEGMTELRLRTVKIDLRLQRRILRWKEKKRSRQRYR